MNICILQFLLRGALNIPFIQNIGQAFSLILEMMHIFLYKLDLHKSGFLWKLGFLKNDFNRHLFFSSYFMQNILKFYWPFLRQSGFYKELKYLHPLV